MKHKLLIRFDDLCPTMDYTQWNRAVELLDRHGVKPLIGIIPCNEDPKQQIEPPHEDFWDEMLALQQRGYAIAMHGYTHVYDSHERGMLNLGHNSEFAGHPYEEQERRIRLGKEALEAHGIHTDVFFAPSHSYDEDTLRALAANGFRYMDDGMSRKPLVKHGLTCIPARNGGVAKIPTTRYFTGIFHTSTWSIKGSKGYALLESLLNTPEYQVVDFEEYKSQPQGWAWYQRLNEKLYFWYLRVPFQHVLEPLWVKVLRPIVRR